jgi:hypothetical protein
MNNKKAIERADIDVFLKCLKSLDNFTPTSLIHDDKPDFVITKGIEKIGVETTRAVHQEVVRARKLQHTRCPNSWIILTNLKNPETRRSNEEIIRVMTNPLRAWQPSEKFWSDWITKIERVLKLKRKKFNQADYQVFNQNWLLIHDYPPLPDWNHTWKCAWRNLEYLFSRKFEACRDFDTVFVHSGSYLFRWHRGHLALGDIAIVRQLTLIENSMPI